MAAVRDVWKAIHKGQTEALNAGPAAVPDNLASAQAEKCTPT